MYDCGSPTITNFHSLINITDEISINISPMELIITMANPADVLISSQVVGVLIHAVRLSLE